MKSIVLIRFIILLFAIAYLAGQIRLITAPDNYTRYPCTTIPLHDLGNTTVHLWVSKTKATGDQSSQLFFGSSPTMYNELVGYGHPIGVEESPCALADINPTRQSNTYDYMLYGVLSLLIGMVSYEGCLVMSGDQYGVVSRYRWIVYGILIGTMYFGLITYVHYFSYIHSHSIEMKNSLVFGYFWMLTQHVLGFILIKCCCCCCGSCCESKRLDMCDRSQ